MRKKVFGYAALDLFAVYVTSLTSSDLLGINVHLFYRAQIVFFIANEATIVIPS